MAYKVTRILKGLSEDDLNDLKDTALDWITNGQLTSWGAAGQNFSTRFSEPFELLAEVNYELAVLAGNKVRTTYPNFRSL